MTIDDVERDFTDLDPNRPGRFREMAEAVLAFQRAHNPVYGRYARSGRYLPVAAFKYAPVATFPPESAERVFESSGTGQGRPSRHYVRRLEVYERACEGHFRSVFGRGPFTFVAHLPHYSARGTRSSR